MAKKFYTGIDVVNNRIINVASPSGATDAVNKQYADNLARGLDWKESVRATTTTNGTLATAYAAGQVIDGYTLVTGDRILLKNQTTASENGVFTVAATGAPTRANDATQGLLTQNATVRVDRGGLAGSAWTLSTDDPITVGSTNLVWARSDSGTPYTAGNGLSLSSNSFSVNAGSGIIADGTSTRIDPAVVPRRYATLIGDGVTSSIVVTHSLGTRDIDVILYDAATFERVDTDISHTTTTTVTLTFGAAPASNAFRAVVFG